MKHKKTWIVVALLIAPVVAIGALAVYRWRQASSRVSEAIVQRDEVNRQFSLFRQAVLDKNYQAAFQLMGPEFQKELTSDEFIAVFQRLERQNGNLRDIEKIDIAGTLNGATSDWKIHVLSRFVYSNGSVKVLHEFHREVNGWKMYTFQPHWSE